MNRAETIDRVTLLGAVGSRPVLDPTKVATIVDAHRIIDANGVAPGLDGWAETYDVNAAVAEVYRVKAGLVSGDFNFAADDAQFSKGDVLANLLEMEAFYSARAGSGSGQGSSGLGTIQVTGTNGPYDPLDRIARTVIP